APGSRSPAHAVRHAATAAPSTTRATPLRRARPGRTADDVVLRAGDTSPDNTGYPGGMEWPKAGTVRLGSHVPHSSHIFARHQRPFPSRSAEVFPMSGTSTSSTPWNDRRITFVGGLHRSGSALVARIISASDDASGLTGTGVVNNE